MNTFLQDHTIREQRPQQATNLQEQNLWEQTTTPGLQLMTLKRRTAQDL
ncbi:hypothetical protein [Synechococcus sp. BIOS-E4-1]|nr:hypothetical protein [Synechococcus sp. BIOS-E4-1]